CEAGAVDHLLGLPLGAVVRNEVLRLLAHAERAHVDEPRDTGLLRGGEEIARPFDHDPAETLLAALTDGDEVYDGVGTGRRAPQAVRIGHVAGGDLGAPRPEPRGLP